MSPLLRRTWAPRGLTPILAVRQRHYEKVSALGALVVSPYRQRVNLYLTLHPRQNIRGPHVLRFLRHLRRHLPGPLLLLWDRGKPHRHRQVRDYLERHRQWQVEWLPPYAPDLNPQEQVWNYLKYGRLSNFAPHDVEQIRRRVRQHTQQAARRPQLLKNLFPNSRLLFLSPRRPLLTQTSACPPPEPPTIAPS
jgi:transposase